MDERKTFENPETGEQRLKWLLKEKPKTSETRKALENWTIDQEQQVENTPIAVIEFNLRRGRLYLAAGYKDEALENFEAAREQAFNERRDELYNAIEEEMYRLEI